MMNLLCLQLLQCRYQGPIVIIMGNGNMRTVSTMPCLSSSSCHLQIQVACDVYIENIQDFSPLLNILIIY